MTKRNLLLALSFALLLALLALPVAAQSFPDPGTGSTVTELANKTANAAQVSIFYYDQNGSSIPGPSPSIPGNGSVAIDPASSQLPQGFNGAGVASSNQPLAAVVETDYTGGPGDGFQMGFYTGVSQGSSKICFPSLWKVSGANAIIASFAVQNTGTSAAAVELTYVSRDGTSQGTFNDNIPVGAQHTYDLATPGGAVPNVPLGWEGSASVRVTNGGTVAGVAVINRGGSNPAAARTEDYNASDCANVSGATTLVAPTAYRVKNPNWTQWSALNVQNLSNNTANVTYQFTPRNPANPSLTVNGTIAPNAAQGINTRTGGNFPASTFDPLNVAPSWDGTVTVTSDQPVVGTVITQWDRNGSLESGFYSAVSTSQGATKWFTPNVKRIVSGSNWSKWSAVVVQNLGNSNLDATIAFYNRSGTKVLEFANESIAPSASVGYNTRTGGNKSASAFEPLGGAYEGHVVVTSNNGQPMVVVLNGVVRVPGGASGTTNGVPE